MMKKPQRLPVLLVLPLLLLAQFVGAKVGVDEPIIMHAQWMSQARADIKAGDPVRTFALQRLLESADKALGKGPYTIVNKEVLPDSGDKHDYMSIGPYWWPDPSKKDGLPWIRRDGEVNPLSRSDESDKPAFNAMMLSLSTLAKAYYFSQEEKYAAHAALLLDTWFNQPATRMNPNLNFAQAIPGRTKGRGIGIIETRWLMRLADDSILLKGSKAYTPKIEAGLKRWFAEYNQWLLTSDNGKEECEEENNHGTYCEAQVAVFALFTGQPALAKEWVERALIKSKRIDNQITASGEQPLETKRTQPYHYSVFNLEALYFLARAGEHVGVDVWNYRAESGASMRAALDYIALATSDSPVWKDRLSKKALIGRTFYFLQKARSVYGDEKYDRYMLEVANAAATEKRSELTQCLLIAPIPVGLDASLLKKIDPKGNKSRYRCYY